MDWGSSNWGLGDVLQKVNDFKGNLEKQLDEAVADGGNATTSQPLVQTPAPAPTAPTVPASSLDAPPKSPVDLKSKQKTNTGASTAAVQDFFSSLGVAAEESPKQPTPPPSPAALAADSTQEAEEEFSSSGGWDVEADDELDLDDNKGSSLSTDEHPAVETPEPSSSGWEAEDSLETSVDSISAPDEEETRVAQASAMEQRAAVVEQQASAEEHQAPAEERQEHEDDSGELEGQPTALLDTAGNADDDHAQQECPDAADDKAEQQPSSQGAQQQIESQGEKGEETQQQVGREGGDDVEAPSPTTMAGDPGVDETQGWQAAEDDLDLDSGDDQLNGDEVEEQQAHEQEQQQEQRQQDEQQETREQHVGVDVEEQNLVSDETSDSSLDESSREALASQPTAEEEEEEEQQVNETALAEELPFDDEEGQPIAGPQKVQSEDQQQEDEHQEEQQLQLQQQEQHHPDCNPCNTQPATSNQHPTPPTEETEQQNATVQLLKDTIAARERQLEALSLQASQQVEESASLRGKIASMEEAQREQQQQIQISENAKGANVALQASLRKAEHRAREAEVSQFSAEYTQLYRKNKNDTVRVPDLANNLPLHPHQPTNHPT